MRSLRPPGPVDKVFSPALNSWDVNMVTPPAVVLVGFLGYILYKWYTFRLLSYKVQSILWSESQVVLIIIQLRDIPTIGRDGFISSYISAWRSLSNVQELVKEGYAKVEVTVYEKLGHTHPQ